MIRPETTSPTPRTQSSRKDDIVLNTRSVPLAGAIVRVCAMPATGQPCSPLAQIYSDFALDAGSCEPDHDRRPRQLYRSRRLGHHPGHRNNL